jgi:DNA-binding response OmpR family regulator
MRLLLVEDDNAIAQKLKHELERAGHDCNHCPNVTDGLQSLRADRPDVVLLDLMLPDRSGFDFIREARGETNTPIIVLTAQLLGDDKVRALDLGADDYVTKPFWTQELLARLRAVARRHKLTPDRGILRRFGTVVVDFVSMSATVDGAPAVLTPTEFDLLAYFLQHSEEALAVERLVGIGLDSDDAGGEALRVHISRLRRKLGDSGVCIETVWGIGYRFSPEKV